MTNTLKAMKQLMSVTQRSKKVKNRTDALAFALMQKNHKKDLAEVIINRGVKTVNEAMTTAWEMEIAKSHLQAFLRKLQMNPISVNRCYSGRNWQYSR